MTLKHLADLVSIGITTKDRWEDLKVTLLEIKKVNLDSLAIFIFDDGSQQPCPFDFSSFSLKIEFQRFSDSKGLIARRNQLAQTIQTKYYLSLDDDSYPVHNLLPTAVEFAESRPNLFCLGFPIYNPVLKIHQSKSLQLHPYPVRFFIGCGHLLHRQHFLQLGGYREELIHQGEEMEVAARAFQRGLFCYHFPGLEIYHTASNTARNWHRMDFYGARNNVLWNDWFVPNQIKWVKQSRTLISRLIHALKVGRIGQLQGELAGFREISRYKKNREMMSLELFEQWQQLPQY